MSHALGYILVSRRDFAPDADFLATLTKHRGGSLGLLHPDLRVHKVSVPANAETAIAAALANEPNVEFAEVDEVVNSTLTLNDPQIAGAYHLALIGCPAAWDTGNGSGVVVAVVGSGVQANHPDLAANIVAGWNVYNNTSDTHDTTGHETAVAGVIGAVGNNSLDGAGVAYGCHIMPIMAEDGSGNGTFSLAASAIMKASDLGANIVNISWSNLYKSSTVVQAAQQYRTAHDGITCVSANNNGIDELTANVPDMVVVAGTQSNDTFWPTSSFGQMVDVCAPAVQVPTILWNSGYGAGTGTSFATPIVAGVIALIKASRPDFTAEQILDTLYQSAVDLGTQGYDTKFGYGRVSASAALARASAAPAADTTPPVVAITSPIAAATVSGVIGVRVTATDNIAVARVDFKVNGAVLQSETVTPYIFSWDTTADANGSVALTATAYDVAGNSASSSAVNVTVSNSTPADTVAPSLAILNPANGAKVSGNVRIQATAPDASGSVTQVLYIDGVQRYSVVSSSMSYAWNTKKTAKGSHIIKITATDSSSNVATQQITVTV